jgi:Tfp pilus assembly protein PilF
MMNTSPTRMRWTSVLLLILITIWTYANSLTNPFMMDDYPMIVNNRAILDPTFLQVNFSEKHPAGHNIGQHMYYRPVTHLFNTITYLLFKDAAPGYHAANLLLFVIAVLSVYQLLSLLSAHEMLSLLTAAFFAIHPVNGVLVNYITATGYAVLICAVNYSLICLILAGQRRKGFLFYSAGFFGFLMALLSHEIAVAFPLYLLAVRYFAQKMSFRKSFISALPSFCMVLAYLFFRMHYASLKSHLMDQIPAFGLNPATYIATFAHLLMHYLKNLLLLKDIVLIWASPVIEQQQSVWIVGFMGFFMLSLYLIFGKWRQDIKSLALSFWWIGIAPVGLACFSRPNLGLIIEPHWLFFSTFGFCLLTALLILHLQAHLPRRIFFALLVIVITAMISASRSYNQLWANEKQYCRYMMELNPGMRLPTWWLAYAYQREHQYPQARHYYHQALTGEFLDWETYVNLGLIAENRDEEMDYYIKALKINPRAAPAYNNAGIIWMERGEWQKAQTCFEKAMALDYYFIEAKKNLAHLYREKDRVQNAVSLYQEVLKIDPDDTHSRKMLEKLMVK